MAIPADPIPFLGVVLVCLYRVRSARRECICIAWISGVIEREPIRRKRASNGESLPDSTRIVRKLTCLPPPTSGKIHKRTARTMTCMQ